MTKSKMVPRLLLAVGLGIGIVLAILLVREQFTIVEIEHWVGRLGWWAPAIYLTLWLVVSVLCLPRAPIYLVVGGMEWRPGRQCGCPSRMDDTRWAAREGAPCI